MPAFDPARIYDDESYDKAIAKARDDLEKDYPGCSVFIHSGENGKVKVIRSDPRRTLLLAGSRSSRTHCSEVRLDMTTTCWPRVFSRMKAPSKPLAIRLLFTQLEACTQPGLFNGLWRNHG